MRGGEVEIKPQKRQPSAYANVEVKSTKLESSNLTVSKSVLRLFVGPRPFVHMRRNGQELAVEQINWVLIVY